MAQFDLTTIGEGQLRLCAPAGRRLEHAQQFDVFVSGTEANVSGALSRLGWSCGWVSALPDNPLGRRVANEYKLAGLDLAAVTWAPEGRVATYYVEYAVPPRATKVYYDRKESCFSHLQSGDINWAYLLSTRVLHLSGITLALGKGTQALLTEALTQAAAAGICISFDMNYRYRLWSPDRARALTLPLLAQLDILFCSHRDAITVFGCDPSNAKRALRQLAKHTSAHYIVMSCSHSGLLGWERQHDTIQQVPARDVVILDRIGAGDAMVAGVLHGYLQKDFAKGLQYGAVTAALALSQYGDQLLTDKEELEQLLSTQNTMIVR